MIVFDLEWNTGGYGGSFPEIIEIGAVKLDRAAGKILDTFCIYIRPKVHKKFNKNIRHLPVLELCAASPTGFREALALFTDWCGDDRDFGTWGGDDFRVLRQNIRYYGIKSDLPTGFSDLQAAFVRTAGASGQIALYKAVDYCRIPDSFVFHDAVNDAMYTALASLYASEEALEASFVQLGEVVLQKSDKLLPAQYGPFDSAAQMLNSRQTRRAKCPRCGRIMRIAAWSTTDEVHYTSKFSCPAHGQHLLCLDAVTKDVSALYGRTYVVRRTQKTEPLFRTGEDAAVFSCKKLPQKRRRRRTAKKNVHESEMSV